MDKALYWMYQNGLTQYDTLQGYRPDDTLLREEAAKIIGQAYIVLGYDQTTKYTQCTFSDQNIFNHSLAPFIQKTCSYGIFKGAYGKFLPHNSLTKAETLAVLIRIFEGKMSDESLNPRWTIPFVKAKHIALTNETEVSGLDRPITRREVALLIYRFKKLVLSEQFRQIAKNQLELINQDPKKYIPPQTLLANKDKD